MADQNLFKDDKQTLSATKKILRNSVSHLRATNGLHFSELLGVSFGAISMIISGLVVYLLVSFVTGVAMVLWARERLQTLLFKNLILISLLCLVLMGGAVVIGRISFNMMQSLLSGSPFFDLPTLVRLLRDVGADLASIVLMYISFSGSLLIGKAIFMRRRV